MEIEGSQPVAKYPRRRAGRGYWGRTGKGTMGSKCANPYAGEALTTPLLSELSSVYHRKDGIRPMDLGLIAGIVVSALVILVMHWFPWPDGLSRVGAYALGVAAILLGFAVWQLSDGNWRALAGLAAISACDGLCVVVAYRIDHTVVRIRAAEKAEAGDDTLTER